MNEWGPAQDEHRAEFISMIRSNDSLRRPNGLASQVCLSSAAFCHQGLGDGEVITTDGVAVASGGGVNSSVVTAAAMVASRRRLVGGGALGGSTTLGSMAAIGSEGGFFQSKLSVAEKLTERHNKELAKRSGVDLANLDTEGLTASQIVSSRSFVQPFNLSI